MVAASLLVMFSVTSEMVVVSSKQPPVSIAFEVFGESGPWILCAPGMGDLRSQYRLLAPRLAAAGYRVALFDLRGHGGSTSEVADVSPQAIGHDFLALADKLSADAPVTLIGNSYTAASAVWAAVEAPERVANIIMFGPFVRDVPQPFYMGPMLTVLFGGPWGPSAWKSFYESLYPQRQPADLEAHASAIKANLAEPHRMNALRRMFKESKQPCADRLEQVRARTLVVMGDADPDFPSPLGEASFIAKSLHGEVWMVPGAGHYPHVDSIDLVMEPVLRFLAEGSHGT